MGRHSLAQMVQELKAAKKKFTQSVLDRMDSVARRQGIKEMVFGIVAYAVRDEGREDKPYISDIPELDELYELYCEHVDRNGFQARWTEADGWN